MRPPATASRATQMARATNPEKPTLAHHNAGRDLHRHRLSYIAVMKFVTKARDTPYKHRKGKIDFFGFVERLRPQKCAAVDFKEREWKKQTRRRKSRWEGEGVTRRTPCRRACVMPAACDADAVTSQEELDALDVERESLLDVVLAKAQAMGITEKIQRVLIALPYKKPSDSGDDVADELATTISRIEAEDEQATEERPALISGISLVMPGVCLSLLEGPQRLIIGALREFQQSGLR